MSEFVKLGFCRKVHGIRGEFQLTLLNKDETVLKTGHEVLLKPMAGSSLSEDKIFKVTKLRVGNKVIAQLGDIVDRNDSEALIPFDVYFDRNLFPEVNDDEFYLNDLIGCTCITQDDLSEVGKITKVYDNGAHDIIVVQTQSESVEIPLVDNFVHEIDIEKQQVIISLPSYIES